MKSVAKPGIVVVGCTALVALMVIAGFEYAALRRPAEDAAPDRETAAQRAPSPTAREIAHAPTPRPALPLIHAVEPPPSERPPAEPPPGGRPSLGSITGEDQRTRTRIKVDRYVNEAYPAWLRSHTGQECPGGLSELNEYIHENDANDGWGRPLTMYCGAERFAGAKTIEVISIGRDAEARTEDDIVAER